MSKLIYLFTLMPPPMFLFIYWLAGNEFERGQGMAMTVAASLTASLMVGVLIKQYQLIDKG